MNQLDAQLKPALVDLLLSLADDKLMLGHLNSDWTGLAPILEEDIAFSSLAQDDLAHAAAVYEFVAQLVGDDANRLAYGRKPDEYRCAAITTMPDGQDWAVAIARQFFCDHFDHLRLARLAASNFEPLRALAAKMLAEERLAIGHADQWLVRLGRGGDEARKRMQAAVDRLSAPACMLFEPTRGVASLESAGVYPPGPTEMFSQWRAAVENVIEEATLRATLAPPAPGVAGGRSGRHSPEFDPLLAEFTEVYRVEPVASW
ncbi:MAG: 1,2-phenylacetyl-CoA epoxidase subunit PaaC [Phycisphaerae bacterium]